MRLLYEIGIYAIGFFYFLGSIFHPKAKKWIRGRRNWRVSFSKLPKNSIWFHCASLGEFDQALPVIREIKRRNPKEVILVSFFSPSGMDNYQKREHLVDFTCYLPLDTHKNAHDFINLVNPKLAIFIKYEFWPNIITACSKNKIPILSVCSVFRKTQIFFRWYGKFFLSQLRKIDLFLVQNDKSRELLLHYGINNNLVCGDTRYDNVIYNKGIRKEDQKLSTFTDNAFVIIVGSSWKEEEDIIFQFLKSNESFKIIIAPHNIGESNVLRILKSCDENAVRYTEFNKFTKQRILILDTIGHLTNAYNYAQVAFIGGGFSGKLHNILEPAVYGLPVLFGPEVHKFPEAELFISKGIAFKIENIIEFGQRINLLQQHGDFSDQIKEVFNSNSNVSKKIIDQLIAKKFLSID